MMVIFDASAFYSYFGEDKLGTVGGIPNVDRDKLKKELEKEKKYIASSAFIEILVRFKDDGNSLYQICKFMRRKNICLLNNVFDRSNSFSQKEFRHLLGHIRPNCLEKTAYKKIDAKASLESNYTIIFMLFILSSLLLSKKNEIKVTENLLNNFKFEDCDEEKEDIREVLLARALKYGFVADYQKVQDELFKKIKKLYIDDEKKISKEYKREVMNIIERYFFLYECCIDTINSIKDEQLDIDLIIEENKKKVDNIKNDSKHIIEACSKILKKNKFNYSFYEEKIKNILNRTLLNSQVSYIGDVLLKSWIENGGQVKKNDIYDVQLLSIIDKDAPVDSSVPKEERFLLTFDNKLKKFIKKINTKNSEYIEKFFI